MPRPSVYLSPNVRVSVKPLFLQRTGVLEALVGIVDTSAPGVKLMGTSGEELTEDGKRKFWVTLDLLPVQSFALDATCIRYEGPRNNNQQGQALEEQTDAMEVKDEDQQPAVDEEEKVDLFLEAGEQTTDARMARPDDAFYGRCSVRVARGSSLARYFLAFLPIQHLDSVVIPAINMHAATLITNWCPVTPPEYLIWVALFVIMSTMIIPDKKAYWRKSDFAFGPNVDFSMYMTMERFEAINKMHILVTLNPRAYAADKKLYQLLAFIDAYNENLKNVVVPGKKHLCVDDSMNQWLSHGMPFLKNPKKALFHRVEVSGDDQRKKFDNQFPKTIATVLRLVEPWFLSGRTVIANSWFGSPTMVRALKSYGFYTIMQVKKKRYWPRGMPVVNDMVQSLGAAYGSVHVMKSLTDPVFLASLQDKKPKCVIANAGSTCSGGTVKRWINGRMETFARPPVFEEYEAEKGAVNTANNRRDNMPSFHDDVMKTYRWEIRLE